MSERSYVLDASALLALFFNEPGAARVTELWPAASISAVNLSEAVAKLADRNFDRARIERILSNLEIHVVIFDRTLAALAGQLRRETRQLGLSFADRACLATAMDRKSVAVTADRAWTAMVPEVEIELIR